MDESSRNLCLIHFFAFLVIILSHLLNYPQIALYTFYALISHTFTVFSIQGLIKNKKLSQSSKPNDFLLSAFSSMIWFMIFVLVLYQNIYISLFIYVTLIIFGGYFFSNIFNIEETKRKK